MSVQTTFISGLISNFQSISYKASRLLLATVSVYVNDNEIVLSENCSTLTKVFKPAEKLSNDALIFKRTYVKKMQFYLDIQGVQ